MGIKFESIPLGTELLSENDSLIYLNHSTTEVLRTKFGDLTSDTNKLLSPYIHKAAIDTDGKPKQDFGLADEDNWGHVKLFDPNPLCYGYLPTEGSAASATTSENPSSTLSTVLPLRTGLQLKNAITDIYTKPDDNNSINKSGLEGQYLFDNNATQNNAVASYRLRRLKNNVLGGTSITDSNASITTVGQELYQLNDMLGRCKWSALTNFTAIPTEGLSTIQVSNVYGFKNDGLGIGMISFPITSSSSADSCSIQCVTQSLDYRKDFYRGEVSCDNFPSGATVYSNSLSAYVYITSSSTRNIAAVLPAIVYSNPVHSGCNFGIGIPRIAGANPSLEIGIAGQVIFTYTPTIASYEST